jgi:hypothetical protein
MYDTVKAIQSEDAVSNGKKVEFLILGPGLAFKVGKRWQGLSCCGES